MIVKGVAIEHSVIGSGGLYDEDVLSWSPERVEMAGEGNVESVVAGGGCV